MINLEKPLDEIQFQVKHYNYKLPEIRKALDMEQAGQNRSEVVHFLTNWIEFQYKCRLCICISDLARARCKHHRAYGCHRFEDLYCNEGS